WGGGGGGVGGKEKKRRRVGAETEEGGVAERPLAGVPADKIPALPQHDVDETDDRDVLVVDVVDNDRKRREPGDGGDRGQHAPGGTAARRRHDALQRLHQRAMGRVTAAARSVIMLARGSVRALHGGRFTRRAALCYRARQRRRRRDG